MDFNNPNQPVNPPGTLTRTPIPKHPIKNQKRRFILIIGIAVIIIVVAISGGAYYLNINKSDTISQNDLNSPSLSDTWSSQATPTNSITLSNYNVSGPTIIQQTYPKERVNIGGQNYNATQFIISALLLVPEENDYSIFSSFGGLGSITTIDGIEGSSYESVFHLTSGDHNVEIKYINGQCLDNEYLQENYGTEATPLSIYFAIRKKSDKQTIKNYTMFDNPVEIRTESKPYKNTDLYLHCP